MVLLNKLSKKSLISGITKAIVTNEFTRNLAVKHLEKKIYKQIVGNENSGYSKNGRTVRYNGVKAMLHCTLRNLDKKYISKDVVKKLIDTLVATVWLEGGNREDIIAKFKEKHGMKPPMFITLSPTKKCNLFCTGCYASSGENTATTLDWSTVDKIITELHDEMGMRFFVISGGEPLLYKSEGKKILDIPRKWKDSFFLIYTNGMLITESVANEMAELGNITPAISVEGFEEHTDQRRGKGVHNKILKAMANLRKAGVPFGTSVTSTKCNVDVLMGDEFYKFFFEEQGCTYMWMFQYMPIGRKFTTELMINPKERFALLKKWQTLLEKGYFVADFWNSAILSNGCLSCAKEGNGYFYIDWNGNIQPCVFIPYYKDNVLDLFKQDKKIADALFSDLFVKGREWQKKNENPCGGKIGNMLMPCFIRDHHRDFVKIARETKAKPEDQAAKEAMDSEEYHNMLFKFDDELKELTEPYWKKEFAK